MDLACTNVPVNLELVAATSMVYGNGGEPPAKKQRFGDEMNRVAEIVLVLSALGRIRGGKTPTELELELMVEARSKLAGMCQEFTPKDIIGRDDIRAVIEDLGLNGKLKDQRLGFRAPKLTISEKLSLGKRKMEEAKKYPIHTVTPGCASHFSQPNGSVASPGLGTATHIVRISTNQQPLPSGVVTVNQWPSSVATTVNTAGNHFKMERPQMMLNAASQGPATSSANYYAASWSAQPQSTISFSNAVDKKVPVQSSVKATDLSFRPFMSQTPHGTFPATNQPMQGMHYGQASSSGNNHTETAKMVLKVLQPQVKKYPLWNPPSRDYMSRATKCQMCEVTITEVETLLICDACEKAYHLTCLQANNLKGVPKSDWHCSRCVQGFNGKPFPPKYGRAVTTTTAKMPAGVQSSTAKKVGSMDIKVDRQKPIVTTSPGVQNVSGVATTSHSETATVNAYTTTTTTTTTTTSIAKSINIGSQGFKESVLRCTNPPTAIANSSAVMNNGLLSKPLTPLGTMSSTCPSPVGNQVPVDATSNAIPSTPISASLVAQTPTVTENGDSSSTASGTAGHSILNTDLTTQVHSENAKAIEDAAIGQALNANDGSQAPMENVARCENPSELTSHSDSLNAIKTPENGEEASEDGMERSISETCQNHPTESPAATVISDKESKIIAESSMPQENSADQTEKTESQPPSVLSNYHSQAEEETPNAPGDSQEGKGLISSDDRYQEEPSEPEFDNSNSTKEVNS